MLLLCGEDLLQSFSSPGVWCEKDIDGIFGGFGVVCVSRPGSDAIEKAVQPVRSLPATALYDHLFVQYLACKHDALCYHELSHHQKPHMTSCALRRDAADGKQSEKAQQETYRGTQQEGKLT